MGSGVFGSPEFDHHEQVVFASDRESGLRSIIAIHSTALGPAVGGCRIWPYTDEREALTDVLRLSRGMTLKTAAAGLDFGGGKAVVLAPASGKNERMLQALGAAIDRLNGAYLTGEDVGSTVADMVQIRKSTPYVMGLPPEQGGSGDPSRNTALGVFVGLRSSVRRALGRELDGVHVVVQGLGNVGGNLAQMLAEAGARLTLADVRTERAQHWGRQLRAAVVDADAMYDVVADVLSPCALGSVINDQTVERLAVKVVAGGANNQLAAAVHGERLRARGILYAPDFVINAGGAIQLAVEQTSRSEDEVRDRVMGIEQRLEQAYRFGDSEGVTPEAAATSLALARLRNPQRSAA